MNEVSGHATPKARTGKLPKPLTLTGTAKKRVPRSGSAASPRRCSTIGYVVAQEQA
jgi:hypothetical protein